MRLFFLFILLSFSLKISHLQADAKATEITWYGHSACKIRTPQGKVLLIDPWIKNPLNPNSREVLLDLDDVNFILLTHGHPDHLGEALEIARRSEAQIITTYDLGNALVHYRSFPKELLLDEHLGNCGGRISLDEGAISVYFIPAIHSSSVVSNANDKCVYGGNPVGFLIDIKEGPTIYHTGDTDLFSDLKLVSEIKKVDLMFVCIGGFNTMDPQRAAKAVKLVEPQLAIPMHYGTTPFLKGTPEEFEEEIKKNRLKTPVQVLEVGVPLTWTLPEVKPKKGR